MYGTVLPPLLVLALTAGPVPASDAARRELKKLGGSWGVVSVEAEGKKEDVRGKLSWVIAGDKLSLKVGDKIPQGRIAVDPTKSPKAIDLIGPDATAPGIYKLEGDTLTLCYGGKDRPKGFAGKGDHVVTVFRRRKP